MSVYTEFFLNASSTIIQYECIKLTHPSITTKRLVRNATRGLVVTEGTYVYCPMRISRSGSFDDLDQGVKIELGDLGTIIPTQLDLIATANTYLTKPIMEYRVYRSDDLVNPLVGPFIFEISGFTFNDTGCLFEAKAPSINVTKTGQIYSIDRFVGLTAYR